MALNNDTPVEGWHQLIKSLALAIRQAGGDWPHILSKADTMTANEFFRLLAPNGIRFVFQKPIGQIAFYAIRFPENGRFAQPEDFDTTIDKMGAWLRIGTNTVLWSSFPKAAQQAQHLLEMRKQISGDDLKVSIISFDKAYNILEETVV